MISFLLYLLLTTVFFADSRALQSIGAAGRYLGWLPDLLSGAFLVIVAGQAMLRRKLYIHPKYMVLGVLIAMHWGSGAMINAEQPGAIFAGIRAYFKCVPLFLFPMVYPFSGPAIKRVMLFILGLSLLQLPVALYQRFVEYKFSQFQTGDVVRGTLTDSGILSVYLLATIAVVTAFYVRKRLSIRLYALLLLCLFIPTTINETKSTLVLLPLALMLPMLSGGGEYAKKRMGQIIGTGVVGAILFSGFVAIYNQHWGGGGSITEMFTKGTIVDRLYHDNKGYQQGAVGKGYDTGRIDSIMIALKELSLDPVHVLSGLGMGNVAASFSGVLKGAYTDKYADWGVRVTNITYLLWETGAVGVLLVVIFLLLLYRDAKRLASSDGWEGVIGLAWSAVVVIIGIAMFYKTLVEQNAIDYVFWMMSGYVASESLKRQRAASCDPPGA